MQVLNNIPAFSVWKNYTFNVTNLRASMSKLSSGLRINMAGDDPAGLAISERLRAQARNTAAAAGNVENKINYLQTADSWLQKIHDILGSVYEADYVTVPTVSEAEAAYSTEKELPVMIRKLKDEMKQAAKELEFEKAAAFRCRPERSDDRERAVFPVLPEDHPWVPVHQVKTEFDQVCALRLRSCCMGGIGQCSNNFHTVKV